MSSPLDPARLHVTRTASTRGRTISLAPPQGDLQHLHYGRIILDAELDRVRFDTASRETALLCMAGCCTVRVGGAQHAIGQYDGIYVPRSSAVEISTEEHVDLVECSAPVEGDYPLQVIRYSEIAKDSSLKFRAGGASTARDLNIVFGKNVQAGRILAGFTMSDTGNWTSWPPHEHAELLEEVYVYFDMPAPAFGIQMVYTDTEAPEFVRVVHDGDAVVMPAGYHPNVAAPGHGINFIWMMAARREGVDRQFGVVNVQPGFDQAGSGLEASRKAILSK